MKKLNNKGFVLVETMVVTVFIMTIFTIIYMNFYPQIAEYEKREFYDDVDSKYDLYWFKRIVENENMITTNWTTMTNAVKASGTSIYKFQTTSGQPNCNELITAYRSQCTGYVKITGLKKLYLTFYHLGDVDDSEEGKLPIDANEWDNGSNHKLKEQIVDESKIGTLQGSSYDIDEDLLNYLKYLPQYKYGSLNSAQYRLIAEFERGSGEETYKTFATIEVLR